MVYTTNAIEALNRQLRKAIKTKGHFPNEEAARKLIYLAITPAVIAKSDAAAGANAGVGRTSDAFGLVVSSVS